jgi:hypothetical protein
MSKTKINLPNVVIHQGANSVITLQYPASTRRFWRAATALVEIFLDLDFVKETLRVQPLTAASWKRANAVFRRLSMADVSVELTVEESHDCSDLTAMMCLCYFGAGRKWKRAAALLLVWGQIARYQFTGKFQDKTYGKIDHSDPAAQCYERFLREVKKYSEWLPLHEVYRRWLEMRNYQGTDERLLDLKLRLEGISKMYRMALESGGLAD